MIFDPGSFSRTEPASSAVTKSPGANSPASSTKKQRSASPSKATPRSAPSSSVLRTMNSRFSGSSGFGSGVRDGPSGAEKERTGAGVGREGDGRGVEGEGLEDGREGGAGHPVRRVEHAPQRPDRRKVDE